MQADWPFPELPIERLLTLVRKLEDNWPHPCELRPSEDDRADGHRSFLLIITWMQDAGWLMFEALLIGAGGEPRVIDAVLTARGRAQCRDFLDDQS